MPRQTMVDLKEENDDLRLEIAKISQNNIELVKEVSKLSARLKSKDEALTGAIESARKIQEAIMLVSVMRWPNSCMDYRVDPYYISPDTDKEAEPEALRFLRYLYKLSMGEQM